MFSEIINPFLNVRNKVKDHQGNWVDETKTREVLRLAVQNRLEISNDEIHEVFNVWDKKIIIDNLYFATNGNIYPVLMVEDIEYANSKSLLHGMSTTGGWSAPYPSVINARGHDYLEVATMPTEGQGGNIYLKKQIILPNGGKLAFRLAGSASVAEVTYKVVWREIEE